MSKIFITGAAGFIGSQLAYSLWKQGEELVMIDNFSYGSEDNLIFPDCDFRESILQIDVRDKDAIEELYDKHKFDYVYHIAAISPLPDCQLNPAEAIDVNVKGTVNILEAGRRYGVKKIIFASTSAVYENNSDFPSIESNVVPPSLIYPNTKFAAEAFCRSYSEVYGMNITCLRFTNVFGPHIDCLRTQPPVVGYLIREYFYNRAPELHSNGEQRRDFVYVDDLIDLAIKVQKGDGYDVLNVSTNETHSINEVAECVARLMGKQNIKSHYMESKHYWYRYPELYQGVYSISEEILDNEVNKYTILSNEYAKNKYGWTPKVTFEEGIQRTIDFSIKVLGANKNGTEIFI